MTLFLSTNLVYNRFKIEILKFFKNCYAHEYLRYFSFVPGSDNISCKAMQQKIGWTKTSNLSVTARQSILSLAKGLTGLYVNIT